MGAPATNPMAFCTASCTEAAFACDCHPAYRVPSYSTRAAMRRASAPSSDTLSRAAIRSGASLPASGWQNLPGRLPRGCCAPLPDRPYPYTRVPDRACADLAHGDRLQLGHRRFDGPEFVGLSLQLVRRMLRTVHRLADIEVHAPAALAGLEDLSREYFLGRPRLIHGIAGAQCRRQSIQIQIDPIALDALQLRSRIDVDLLRFVNIGVFRRRL